VKFQFITYRWGEDLVGGAEIHHRRLAQELVDLGHEVSVLTTTGHSIRTFCHWGVLWEDLTASQATAAGPIRVDRIPLKKRPLWMMALDVKRLQRQIEKEEAAVPAATLDALLRGAGERGVFLLNGWHYPESDGRQVTRWTHASAWIAVKARGVEGRLVLKGHAAKRGGLTIHAGGKTLLEATYKEGYVELECPMPPDSAGLLELRCGRIWRPWKDFRSLGLMVSEIAFHTRSGEVLNADLWEDYRSLGRGAPGTWQAFLLGRAAHRPKGAGKLFDRLRGPVVSKSRQRKYFASDAIRIHCNMPWATISGVGENDLAMPLWHIEDEFYYWQHWVDALRQTRFVLANTPYTAERFFPGLGIKARFVGPPIWEPKVWPTDEQRAEFRRRHQIDDDAVLVLTVCRKSGEKRYEAIAASVARLAAEGLKIRMVGVGPDHDRRPFHYAGCEWLGQLTGENLQVAYAACDVFCLMSESESFGMVIPEAWHHGKPVVVNRRCGPSASLVAEGIDGLLAEPGADLDVRLRDLAQSPELRQRCGEAGRAKARRDHVRGAAGKRLMAALET
jgi:glycosyltransferase involved in cell wall biosynthesis